MRRSWVDHVRCEHVSRNVEDGMKQLLDLSVPHLAVCIWVRNPMIPRTASITPQRERPSSSHITPLHYATLVLVIETLRDVNSQGFTDSVTPLHLASDAGNCSPPYVRRERDRPRWERNDSITLCVGREDAKSLAYFSNMVRMWQPKTIAGRYPYIWHRGAGIWKCRACLLSAGQDEYG
jgi:hypothetical protein